MVRIWPAPEGGDWRGRDNPKYRLVAIRWAGRLHTIACGAKQGGKVLAGLAALLSFSTICLASNPNAQGTTADIQYENQYCYGYSDGVYDSGAYNSDVVHRDPSAAYQSRRHAQYVVIDPPGYDDGYKDGYYGSPGYPGATIAPTGTGTGTGGTGGGACVTSDQGAALIAAMYNESTLTVQGNTYSAALHEGLIIVACFIVVFGVILIMQHAPRNS